MLLMDNRRDIEARALAHAAEHERKHGKPIAEILTDRGEWYVLRVTPGREAAVAAHLAGRRFGVYVPMAKREREGREYPLCPGYVCVFVWDMEAQWRRIKACPDVQGLAYEASDGAIRELRLMEANEFAKHYKGRTKRRRKGQGEHSVVESVRGYTGGVDGETRRALFRKVLGLGLSLPEGAPRMAADRSPKGRSVETRPKKAH